MDASFSSRPNKRQRRDASSYSQTPPLPSMPLISSTRAVANDDVIGDCDRLVDTMVRDLQRIDALEQWDNIYGNKVAKEMLFSTVVSNLEKDDCNLTNVVLFGPPSTGKTMLCKAAGGFTDWTFFDASGDVAYHGQPEMVIMALFKRARQCQPACIVLDNADRLLNRRTTAAGCKFFAEMSNVMHEQNLRIMVIAITDRPADVDEFFLRRFGLFIYVRLPDGGTILEILQKQLGKYDLDTDVTVEILHDLATQMASKRTLSGNDVTRAVVYELKTILQSSWSETSHFREVSRVSPLIISTPMLSSADKGHQETGESGQKVLVACLPKDPGAFKFDILELSDEQMRQLRLRKVKMVDVKEALENTVAVTSVKRLQEYEKFKAGNGMRTF